ncbi:MAG: hypothetical protein AM324_010985 [Candidatus Thorarchaeota archaeon SMTZ1-83]|nr:MAG: hypothetical protein AM324_12300 [Candidatus Thorarchaeota archaeon SMTZ1-83]
MIEELEDTETDTRDVEDEAALVGPELKLVGVHANHSVRRRTLDVVALLSNVEDEEDVYDITVLSISSEIAKVQAIAYETVYEQAKASLRNRRVSEVVVSKLAEEACKALEEESVVIAYE